MLKFIDKVISAVWIDLDDTIIDFKANSRIALGRLYESEGLGRYFESEQDWIRLYEAHNYDLWGQYASGEISQEQLRMERFMRPLSDRGVAACNAMRMAPNLDRVYLDRLAEGSVLIDGAVDLLSYLRDGGVKIGILSNGFKDVQHRKIENAGLNGYFDFVVLSDDAGITKPAPGIFAYAMKIAAEHVPGQQLMIGDNRQTDICGAISSGWNAIMYDRSLPLTFTSSNGYHIVSALRYIPALLH